MDAPNVMPDFSFCKISVNVLLDVMFNSNSFFYREILPKPVSISICIGSMTFS